MTDHAEKYARSVIDGTTPGNKSIKAAAARFLEEIKNPPEGLIYRPEIFAEIYDWCFEHVKMTVHGEPRPFEFLPWQCFLIGQAENWRREENPAAVRYRVVAAEAARGSGKTAASLAWGIYRLVNIEYQQITVTAQGMRQLGDVWISAIHTMLRESPALDEVLKVSSTTSSNASAKCESTQSAISFRATTGKALQGLNGIAFCDELGETAVGGDDFLSAIEQGTSKQAGAFMCSITTPPPAKLQAGPYNLRRSGWIQAVKDGRTDTLFLPWGIDDEDPIEGGETPEERKRVWSKAYPPGFDAGLKTLKDYEEQLARDQAQDTLAEFEIRHCCRFTTSGGGDWLPTEWIEQASVDMSLEILRDRDTWAGIDMSKSGDMTSISAISDVNGQLVLFSWHFLPNPGKRSKFYAYGPNLEGWKDLPHVNVAEGPRIDYAAVSGRLDWLQNHVNLRMLKYDDWSGPDDDAIQELLEEDFPWSPQPQHGRDWSGATSRLQKWLACNEKFRARLQVQPDPLLVFAASCAARTEDMNGNIRLIKQKSTGSIDPLISCVLAVAAHTEDNAERSVFDTDAGSMIF